MNAKESVNAALGGVYRRKESDRMGWTDVQKTGVATWRRCLDICRIFAYGKIHWRKRCTAIGCVSITHSIMAFDNATSIRRKKLGGFIKNEHRFQKKLLLVIILTTNSDHENCCTFRRIATGLSTGPKHWWGLLGTT